ncbi:MAG: winged helix-turn-helix domain-containing protein [Bacteroidia bacterium]|nr:winged helix-turn-helix domain-containing protein [Bacteroidia bacterium]
MIPDLDSVKLSYLKVLADSKEWGFQEVIETLAQTFKVSYEERQETIPSNQKIFDYRVGCARTFFIRDAGFVESTRHGYARITQRGLNFLSKNPNPDKILKENKKGKTMTRTIKKENNNSLKGKEFVLDIQYIQALGNLLAFYHSDLIYIREFQRYKNGGMDISEYLEKSSGAFQRFVNEFGVARCFVKCKTNIRLQMTIDWTSADNSTDVDGFVETLNREGITHGKATSLVSKILFLNNPWKILPTDNRTKQSLGLKSNLYAPYLPLAKEFTKRNEIEINRYLNSVDQYLTTIEATFSNEIENLKTIRLNRFVDKILWTGGRDL